MKKLLIVMVVAFLALSMTTPAFAGGGGPPKDILKGVFTQVDKARNTAIFKQDGSGEILTLSLGSSMTTAEIPLNKKVMVDLDKETGEGVIKDISIMFMDMTANKMIFLIIVGLVGGLLSGFIGSGGAFVLTPAMMSLGVPGVVAVASNMCHKFPKAMVGAYKRFKYGQVDLKLALVMAVTAIIGVQIGIKIQKFILNHWGNAGSNLYVSIIFVIVLVVVGFYVFLDAFKLSKGGGEAKVSKLALTMQKIKIPPMIHFKVAKLTISAWITIPVGLATGMLAATIAVGGFIGVPGMIYVIGASAVVASATELGVAFIMGMWGSVQWGLSGLIDIRLTLLILSASLIGVQLGALGTTYVKDHMIKIVMGTVMLIVAVSRGTKIPGYLADLGLRAPLNDSLASLLNRISFWSLVTALVTASVIITGAMVHGMYKARGEKQGSTQKAVSYA
ncbi:MAG TPA: sulfite exporter TauE/SafE family protein [Desulfatiglandales bacterium]|nr:sulfite exporter TauE/SafE family protein [Desulfatiglandales bacterium]